MGLSTIKIDEIMQGIRTGFVKEANAGHVGFVSDRDVREILPENVYRTRHQFLQFCESHPVDTFADAVVKTPYYLTQKNRNNEQVAVAKCRKYYNLLLSIRQCHLNDRSRAPVIIVDENNRYIDRLDGTHRISIMRHLGYDKMPVVSVTEEDYTNYALANMPTESVKAEMQTFGKWYQAVEVLPDVWTHPCNQQKEKKFIEAIRSELPYGLEGFNVFDLGCNSGLYSFEAARQGAKKVIGLDKRDYAIEQAEFVQKIWRVTNPPSGIVQFSCGNVFENYKMLDGMDILFAACVLYHLGDGLFDFMEKLSRSSITVAVVQGNLGRSKKSSPEEIDKLKKTGVNSDTSARLIYDVPQFEQLFGLFGFKLWKIVPSRFPVAVFKKG